MRVKDTILICVLYGLCIQYSALRARRGFLLLHVAAVLSIVLQKAVLFSLAATCKNTWLLAAHCTPAYPIQPILTLQEY